VLHERDIADNSSFTETSSVGRGLLDTDSLAIPAEDTKIVVAVSKSVQSRRGCCWS